MAQIYPFAALRYDADKVGGLQKVVTQPYDKISPEMRERYQALSPYNLSYIIKTANYEAAAQRLRDWTAAGVLRRDPRPAIYPYFQTYRVPGAAAGDPPRTRRGFIAAGKLEDYSAGIVHRHEQTLSGPKQDRLQLLRATRVHFGQIFMLYSDPAGEVDRLIERATAADPIERSCDEYGVDHRVWRIDAAEAIGALQRAMAPRKLVIADGHHRYETALAFRDECRRSAAHRANGACEAVMMTLVNMDAPGLTVLPTHRVLARLAGFDREKVLEATSRFFQAVPCADAAQLQAQLGRSAAGEAIGVALGGGSGPEFVLLRRRPDVDLAQALPGLSPAERRLDVAVLHQLLLKQCLGIGEEAVREEKFLEYVREFEKGVDAVRRGAPACFFLNPVRMDQMRDIAFAGGVMPQKSTDFYPKMLSGLTGYSVED